MSKADQCCRNCHWAEPVSGTKLIVMCGVTVPEWVEHEPVVQFYNDGKDCSCWKPKKEEGASQ
jgi:hypothetical protein